MTRQSKKSSIVLKRIGMDLKQKRKDRNLTQTELAEALNMNVSNYNKIEKGYENVTINTLEKIYDVLGYKLIPENFSILDKFNPKNVW